jgi:hypothetical protein
MIKFEKLFYYKDGELYWKIQHTKRVKPDQLAGTVSGNNHRIVTVNRKIYQASHVIWYLFNKTLPSMIDHIDNNSLNNSIENLRLCDKSTNGFNAKLSKRNTSGTKGVYFDNTANKWFAELKVNRKRHRKSFIDKDLAINYIKNLRLKLHGDFGREK